MALLELKCLSHEDLSNQFCVDWLKAREAHFLRHRNLERSDLSGIPRIAVFGPIIYRPLKELGSPGKILSNRCDENHVDLSMAETPKELKTLFRR